MRRRELTGILKRPEQIRAWARREARKLIARELIELRRERHRARARAERSERIAAKRSLGLRCERPRLPNPDSRDLLRLWKEHPDFDPRT